MRLTTAELLAERAAGLRQNANDPGTAWVLAERDGALVGAMRLYDFTMNVHGRDGLAGGVGAVAVSRAHKRQGIARAIIAQYLDTYRRRRAPLSYLHAQRDQFARIVVESQDPAFYLASSDPRDGSDLAVAPPAAHAVAETGLGMMYRILDLEAALGHLAPSAESFTVALAVDDPFQAATHGTWTVRFGPGGAPRLAASAEPDARLAIGIADLSSVVMGSLRLNDVVRHGLARVEPPARLAQVDAAFRAAEPPQSMTRF